MTGSTAPTHCSPTARSTPTPATRCPATTRTTSTCSRTRCAHGTRSRPGSRSAWPTTAATPTWPPPAGAGPNGGVSRLTATTRCLRNNFRWINHTLTHPELNFTDYATNVTEINQNLAIAAQLGLPVDRTVLKTGEYSGLGVYNPDPNNDTDPPTDYGLGASNPELLRAAKDLGVQYLHGNMSFPSHQPAVLQLPHHPPDGAEPDRRAGLADQHRVLRDHARRRRPRSTTRSTARTASSHSGPRT